MRIVVACFALAYLTFARPWSQSNHSIAIDSYSCAATLFTLALFPKGTRLWLAVGVALCVGLLVVIAAPEGR
jgi:hypothetical protein